MLAYLLNPALVGLVALVLAVIWMLRDETDKTRPLLVLALVINLFYGWILTFVMGRENGLVPWKYDYVLLRIDHAMGISGIAIAAALQGVWRIPLVVLYQLMVPMMIAWFIVVRVKHAQQALVFAYIAEMVAGPALYTLLPACGPAVAFHKAWLHPPLVAPAIIRLSGMPNAFPSLHVGTAVVLLVFARGKWPRFIALAFLAGTVLATLSTGEHYTIDLVAGLAFGCFAAAAGQRQWGQSGLFFAMVLGWSLGIRFGYTFLLQHVAVLQATAALTTAAAVLGITVQSRSTWGAADLPALAASVRR